MAEANAARDLFVVPGKKKSEPDRLKSTLSRVVVGADPECNLTLDDPLVSERHVAFEFEGGTFYVSDEGTATGSYLNGFPVEGRAPLAKGDVIVLGCSRLKVAALEQGDAPQLRMSLDERKFHFEDKTKKDGGPMADTYELVRSEVGFARSRTLALANWVGGALAVLLVLALFTSGPRELLAEPGDLHATHARLFDDPDTWRTSFPDAVAVAQEQGCAACHAPYGNTPMERCANCHRDLLQDQHPFSAAPIPPIGDYERHWSAGVCTDCHLDHPRDAAWDLVPPPETTPESCDTCHESRVSSERMALSVARTFEVEVAYDAFSHADHLTAFPDMGCAVCHGKPRDPAPGGDRLDAHDYDDVLFETCERCHSADASRRDGTLAEFHGGLVSDQIFDVTWHGANDDGGQECQACHAETYAAELAQDPFAMPVAPVRFDLARFFDHGRFFRDHPAYTPDTDIESCKDCHREGEVSKRAVPQTLPFWHDMHMAELIPDGDDAARMLSSDPKQGCQTCHTGIAAAPALSAEPWRDTKPEECTQCHEAGAPTVAASETQEVLRPRFPHGVHVAAFDSSPSLARGCFACHEFEARGEGDAVHSFAKTKAIVAGRCFDCHDNHANVGGGDCQECHQGSEEGVLADIVWSNGRLARNDWPEPNTFDHRSPGHVNEDCRVCHKGTEGAQTVRAVPIPGEDEESCRTCHLGEQRRFHWR